MSGLEFQFADWYKLFCLISLSVVISFIFLGTVPDPVPQLKWVRLDNNSLVFRNISSTSGREDQLPYTLTQRELGTVISSSTQAALCAFIAATTVSNNYPEWQCTTSGTVVTQPCDGLWYGIGCNSNGDIESIYMYGYQLYGKRSEMIHDTLTLLWIFNSFVKGLCHRKYQD